MGRRGTNRPTSPLEANAKNQFYRRVQRIVAAAVRETARAHDGQLDPGSVAKRTTADLWALFRAPAHPSEREWRDFVTGVLGGPEILEVLCNGRFQQDPQA